MGQPKKNNRFVLAILSSKGGVGKTMLAVSLIDLLGRDHYKINALDFDVNAPNLAIWLGGTENLDEVLPIEIFPLPNKYKRCKKLEVICDGEVLKVENEKRGEVKIKKDFTPSFGNYKLNLISGSIDEGKTGSGKVVEGVIEAAGQFEAQIQILDSAPGTGYPVLTPLKESDFAILITEPTVLGFSDLKKLVAITKNNNKFGVVINKESLNPELGKEIEIWSSPNFLGRIDFFPEIEENLKNKVPPTLKKSKISKQIENIYHLILNQAKVAHL